MVTPGTVSRKVAGRLARIQRYHVRVRFLGSIDFVCPWCGHINKARMSKIHFRVYCSGTGCGAWFIPKLTLMAGPYAGRATTPPDFVIPDAKGEDGISEAFPLGDLEYWRQGGCVHEVKMVTVTVKETMKEESEDGAR